MYATRYLLGAVASVGEIFLLIVLFLRRAAH